MPVRFRPWPPTGFPSIIVDSAIARWRIPALPGFRNAQARATRAAFAEKPRVGRVYVGAEPPSSTPEEPSMPEPTNPLVARHQTFLGKQHGHFIDGRWVAPASGEYLPVHDPSDGTVVTHIAAGNADDIERAVASSRRAFEAPAWAKMKPVERERLLWRLSDLLMANADELAELESIDIGKPLSVARNGEVPSTAEFIRYMAGWATKLEGATLDVSVPRLPQGEFHAFTKPEPVGVVGAITPWNFPLSMAAWKFAPALAVGCTVVLKPAEQTSLTALRLAELAVEAGFPAGVLNVVTGLGREAGRALCAHPGIDKLSFTGSVLTGQEVGIAAVKGMKRFTLELGGKSPVIVFEDADLEQVADAAASAIFFNQGQNCTAGSRLYVARPLYAPLLERLAAKAKAMRPGPGYDETAEIGPLVSEAQLERVTSYVASGLEENVELVAGGRRIERPGYYLEPTIFGNVGANARIMREEIFGPVLATAPFDTEDEVVALANDSTFGLAASIWTKDLARAHRMTRRLEAGTVWVNCHNMFDPNFPFGGLKYSGLGRELGRASIESFIEMKSVMMRIA
jgi:phenylacetaldehyde dehydrogenase